MGTCRLGSPLRRSTPLPSSLTSGYSPNSETLALLEQAVLLNPPPDLCRSPPHPATPGVTCFPGCASDGGARQLVSLVGMRVAWVGRRLCCVLV